MFDLDAPLSHIFIENSVRSSYRLITNPPSVSVSTSIYFNNHTYLYSKYIYLLKINIQILGVYTEANKYTYYILRCGY